MPPLLATPDTVATCHLEVKQMNNGIDAINMWNYGKFEDASDMISYVRVSCVVFSVRVDQSRFSVQNTRKV